jgi:predicted transcriptional regulator YdeE
METIKVEEDIHVFGTEVRTFPAGVKEAFDALEKKIPDGRNRAYYGLSRMKPDGGIFYVAAAEEKQPGEAEKLNYTRYTIAKGEYAAQSIHNWMENIDKIKDVFHELLQKDIDENTFCVEWYKSDDEMICMVKVLTAKPVQSGN